MEVDGQSSSNSKVRKGVPEANGDSSAKRAKQEHTDHNGESYDPRDIHYDWPAAGAVVDLAVHDLPHASSDTEWWYFNAHVKTPDGRPFSLFASFFRAVSEWSVPHNAYEHVHSVIWAVVDVQEQQYLADGLLDPASNKLLLRQLRDGDYRVDHRLRRSMIDMLEKGGIPLPDRVAPGNAKVSETKLDLNYSGLTFYKDAAGDYHCHCEEKARDFSFTIKLKPLKKVILHGHDGTVKIGRKGDDMFYYFIPRCETTGSVSVAGKTYPVSGTGWYDHEFGGQIRAAKPTDSKEPQEPKTHRTDYGWNWLAVQLEDGTDISATTVVNPDNNYKVLDNYAIIIGPNSERTFYKDTVELRAVSEWVSCRSAADLPDRWVLNVPDAGIHLEVAAVFKMQECMTVIAKPSFFEGRCEVVGTIKGVQVKGTAFLERAGFGQSGSMDGFFSQVSKLTKKEVARLLPLDINDDQMRDLMADKGMEHYMDGADRTIFMENVIKPIREYVDRGGKSWRSYALLLCVDCVGGSSYDYQNWLAMPEVMHVGSLIVDDIQDKSQTRRGGPSVHTVWGESLAINAGTAAYFIGATTIKKANLPHDKLVKIYELYFLTLRAGHAGQAYDITGQEYLMDDVIKTGNNDALLRAVVCTHRLKSAVPAGNLARTGAILGGGTAEQTEALGRYFESIGVAFQIIDDVLNLKGLAGKGKHPGEDIGAGKITYPVAVALNGKRMNLQERKWLYDTISSKPEDQKVIDEVIARIAAVGGLADAQKHAEDMVNTAWNTVEKVLPDSQYKLSLRAFGWYVLERHY